MTFKKFYLIFAGVLLLLMIVCCSYVGFVLSDYQDSQPESRVEAEIEKIKDAAKDGNISSALNVDGLSSEDTAALTQRIANAKEFTSKLTKNENGGESLVYTVMADGTRVADVHMTGATGETVLVLFPMTDWEITKVCAAEYEFNLSLPASMKLFAGDKALEGEISGGKIKYNVKTKSAAALTVADSFGNTAEYDGISKIDITEYVVQIPSNFAITSADGSQKIPVNTADLKDNPSYKYVSQYTDMPKKATYKLGLFSDKADFVITDNLGQNVEYTMNGHSVVIEDQASLPAIPADISDAETVLGHARTWSLFMTDDVGGALHGYNKVKSFLLPDSYLEGVAYEWATGVDITFTSVHRLDNPPFSKESVSNFVKYSDNCFSVDVSLEKMMHLNSGDDVLDKLNGRFYYVFNDGWYLADIEEIIN